MTEFVAISTEYDARQAVHEIEDGELACGPSRIDDVEIVPRAAVPELDRCKHCAGGSEAKAGRGGALAAKLAAADPEEVSSR